MKFLADMGVSITTVEALRAAHHHAVHLREEGLIRLPDPEIAAKAAREDRVVLTFDLILGIFWLRAVPMRPVSSFFACEIKRPLP